MLLPDHEIRAAVDAGRLGIDPYDPSLVQPASVDLRLDNVFLTEPEPYAMFPDYIDPSMPSPVATVRTLVEPGEVFPLQPGQFALASTVETIRMPADLTGMVAGKSSLARLGLLVEAAGWVDAGFEGQITWELFNMTRRPIVLHPGMRIGQLCLFQMSSPARHLYGSKKAGSRYQGQRGPTPSLSHIGFRADLPAIPGEAA